MPKNLFTTCARAVLQLLETSGFVQPNVLPQNYNMDKVRFYTSFLTRLFVSFGHVNGGVLRRNC